MKCNNQQGGIYLMTLILMLALIFMGISTMAYVKTHFKSIEKYHYSLKSLYLAEAGIEKAIVEYLLKDKNRDWQDDQNLTLFENEKLGDGNFSVFLKTGSKNKIIIAAVGESHGITNDVHVLVGVNWKKNPPGITILQWQRQEIE